MTVEVHFFKVLHRPPAVLEDGWLVGDWVRRKGMTMGLNKRLFDVIDLVESKVLAVDEARARNPLCRTDVFPSAYHLEWAKVEIGPGVYMWSRVGYPQLHLSPHRNAPMPPPLAEEVLTWV
jgi:hypothetical protein